MKIIESIEEMHNYSQQLKSQNKTIGYVATDSHLHEGHMSLVDLSRENSDVTVLSAEHTFRYLYDDDEEYDDYITIYQGYYLEKDLRICMERGVDIFFQPKMHELYSKSNPYDNIVNSLFCNRPYLLRLNNKTPFYPLGNHLSLNLTNDVYRLFNIILPDVFVQGQKDIYQYLTLQYLVDDFLKLPIKLIMGATIREQDGLACSSRNRFLTSVSRQQASSVYQSLLNVAQWENYPNVDKIKEYITDYITTAGGTIVFIEVFCIKTLEELEKIDRKAVLTAHAIFAADYGGDREDDITEIFDNIIIEP